MRIAENYDVKLAIFDIETPKGMFCIGIYEPDSKKWDIFEISKYRNDLYSLVKYYTKKDHFDYWVSFNGIGFDHQVLQYILEQYENWFDLDGVQVANKIWDFAQKIIDDGKYDIQPPYKEEEFPVRALDLFRIHHFDNKGRRTSLKWCAYMMNMNVEEMPHHHTKDSFTKLEAEELKSYMRNDIIVTYKLLEVTLGITDIEELADYNGKNKIQDRIDVFKETGMDCMNWSDVKIGEEWNKLDYKTAKNIDEKGERKLFPVKPRQPFGQPFRNFFPETLDFTTKSLADEVKIIGNEYVKNKKQKFPVTVGKTTYTIAKGGIHSTEKHRMIKSLAGMCLSDIDVQSQYPNAFLKFKVRPPHLEDIIYNQVEWKIARRVQLKDKAKVLEKAGNVLQARPCKSVQEMLKLCLNGGLYGKMGQKGSFLEYPEGVLKICMGNQIEILMLVEMMEQAGFQVVSGNTDGIMVIYHESKKKLFLEICAKWENKVGNIKLGKLEHTDFEAIWQESINHYIAKGTDGKVKKKGRFVTIYGSAGCEINKNKSKRVVALALEQYFINGKNPIDFITNHKNIYDFCIGKKAFGDLHYEEVIDKDNVIVHKKLVRYYVSNSGNVFMKRGKDQYGVEMNNHCEAPSKDFPWMGQPKCAYYNIPVQHKDFSKYDINYKYYILETLERIDLIEKTKKAKVYADTFKTTQGSLF